MPKKSTLTLPERIDISEAESLQEKMHKLLAKDGEIIELKAGKVEKADSAGVQLLVSFKQVVTNTGKQMNITNASEEFIQALDLLGVTGTLEIQ